LDIAGGGKARPASYRRYIKTQGDYSWVTADYNAQLAPDYCFDAMQEWPFVNESFDYVLLINSLHIFSHPLSVLKEAARVLKYEGKLLVEAQLIFHENPEPMDHFRFTSQGLRLLLEQTGMNIESFVPYGGRFMAIVDFIHPYLRKFCLFFPLALFAYRLDHILQQRISFEREHPAPFGYIALASK